MTMQESENSYFTKSLITPSELIQELPSTAKNTAFVRDARQQVSNILSGKDPRLLIIAGPCSIHDTKAALEYAERLKKLSRQYADELFILMRVYFEKPRSVLGWGGFINDPHLNKTFDINYGLEAARRLLIDVINLELPTATEFLEIAVPNYLSDLICWNAVGARTVTSQIHRQLASGLSMPVGFKNTVDGNIQMAVDAILTAQHTHHYLGFAPDGKPSIIATHGNQNTHLILRGSNASPNYFPAHIHEALQLLKNENLPARLMIDCSHGNSMKDYRLQKKVAYSLAEFIENGNDEISGIMLESNLLPGRQMLLPDKPLVYGQSITDACISWEETQTILKRLAMTKLRCFVN